MRVDQVIVDRRVADEHQGFYVRSTEPDIYSLTRGVGEKIEPRIIMLVNTELTLEWGWLSGPWYSKVYQWLEYQFTRKYHCSPSTN